MMNPPHSPPLPNLQGLTISAYPPSQEQYRYSGVFGPPAGSPTGQGGQGWGSPNKRGSRFGLPSNWYDPPSRDSPAPFDPYRRDASPPALSPPTSTSSGPTTAGTYPPAYQPPAYAVDPTFHHHHMAVTPSPPPLHYALPGIGMNTAASVPNLSNPLGNGGGGFNPGGLPTFGSQSLQSIQNSHSTNRLSSHISQGSQHHLNGWRNSYTHNHGGTPILPPLDDDVIPTAIVIKNIPFAVSRDNLLGIIEALGAPLPYAFNYHHDNGVFRGLAFANFRAPEEAASVVAALNGYDVQRRKLRVEYKKVLQPGEKEKIEREKALKRMRSIQFDQKDIGSNGFMGQQQQSQQPMNLGIPNRTTGPGSGSARSDDPNLENSPPQSTSSSTSEDLPVTLDLNDPTALDIYSKVLVFKEDRMRDELAFSKSLTPTERRIVHLVAQKLGLASITKGEREGETKYVVVTREIQGQSHGLTSSTSATLGGSFLSPYGSYGINGNGNDNNNPGLRIKKSMPDLRGFNGPAVARDPTRSLTPQRSSGNLRDTRDYGSFLGNGATRRINGFGSGSFNNFFGSSLTSSNLNGNGNGNINGEGDIPPVPPLPLNYRASINGFLGAGGNSPPDNFGNPGGGLGSHNGSGNGDLIGGGHAPIRNPRGPAGESRGFGGVGTLRTSTSQVIRGSGTMLGGTITNSGNGGNGGRVSVSEESEDSTGRKRERDSLDF